VGGQIISGDAQFRHRETSTIWNTHPISFFLEIQRISDRSPFLAIQYDQVGSPPAHRQQISHRFYGLVRIKGRRPAALHRLQQLIQHFEILVLRLQLSILLQRRRSGTQIPELVINQRQVEID